MFKDIDPDECQCEPASGRYYDPDDRDDDELTPDELVLHCILDAASSAFADVEREEQRAAAAAGPQRFVIHADKIAAAGLDCGRWRERMDMIVGYENWRQEKTTPNGRTYVIIRAAEHIMMARMAIEDCMVAQVCGRMFAPTSTRFVPRKAPSRVDTAVRTFRFTVDVRHSSGRFRGQPPVPETIPPTVVERFVDQILEGKIALSEADGVYTVETEDRYAHQRLHGLSYGTYQRVEFYLEPVT